VLITSGPTQEPIDDVRFLTNRSSGKMGAALARAALLMGAQVTVIAGPSKTSYPVDATVIYVRTADEMLQACLQQTPHDLFIGAAAVADYRPANRIQGKLRREATKMSLELEANPDVIAEVAHRFPDMMVVGFAAEPSTDLTTATGKIAKKGIRAIAVNDVSNSAIGFDSSQNELTLLWNDGRSELSGRRTKLGCALWLLERLTG
jgi:phosphopantothenoylcysteine decarboxylase/phosphopantothenate--cysteine ligase